MSEVETKWPFKPEDDVTTANKEAMDAIEKRPEDSTCHSIGGKFFNIRKVPLDDYVMPLFCKLEVEDLRKWVENTDQEPGLTSFQIKALLENAVSNIRKVKEYCESTDYNTEVYEYHNSDCFYYELNEIHAMSDDIIKNFKKKLDTDI